MPILDNPIVTVSRPVEWLGKKCIVWDVKAQKFDDVERTMSGIMTRAAESAATCPTQIKDGPNKGWWHAKGYTTDTVHPSVRDEWLSTIRNAKQ